MLSVILFASSLLAEGPRETAQIMAPQLPMAAHASGEVLLHVEVDASGTPERILTILDAPLFGDALREAVAQWRVPEHAGRDLLVAGVFRSAALFELRTLRPPPSPSIGPRALAFPTQWTRPSHPPTAIGGGVVVVEMQVGDDGVPRDAIVVHSAPGFDTAALEAAAQWRFRPAVRDRKPVATHAYVVFGFRAPVSAPRHGR